MTAYLRRRRLVDAVVHAAEISGAVKGAQAASRNSYEGSPFIGFRSLNRATALPRADPTSRATFDRTLSGAIAASSCSALNQSTSGEPKGRPRASHDW